MLEVPQFILDRASAARPVFSADEISHWPEGLFALLDGYELVRPTDNATSVVCDACGHDHVEPIVRIPTPGTSGFRVFIVCPEAGRVSVPLERLRQYALDVPKLCEMTGWTLPVAAIDDSTISDPIRLSITEAAKYIGVSDRTIREWRTNGKLNVLEDGSGQLVFSKSGLEILRLARQ